MVFLSLYFFQLNQTNEVVRVWMVKKFGLHEGALLSEDSGHVMEAMA